MKRSLAALTLLAATASADPHGSHVTRDLPAPARAALRGCWALSNHGLDETWTFRDVGEHGLAIVREIGDRSYAERARVPADLLYDPDTDSFGFPAAGRIHAALFTFRITGDHLTAASYYSRTPGSYAWSGNTFDLARCAAKR